jgi:hypothetical protein
LLCHTAEKKNIQINANRKLHGYSHSKKEQASHTQWKRTNNITLRSLINSLKEQMVSAIEEQLSNTWQKTIQKVGTTNTKDTWSTHRCLTNTNPNIPPLTINRKTAITIEEKLNAFADNLKQIFTINPDIHHTFTVSTEHSVNDFLKHLLTVWVRATNHSEIAWIVSHLEPSKAPGPDGTQNIILQHLPQLFSNLLTKYLMDHLC